MISNISQVLQIKKLKIIQSSKISRAFFFKFNNLNNLIKKKHKQISTKS